MTELFVAGNFANGIEHENARTWDVTTQALTSGVHWMKQDAVKLRAQNWTVAKANTIVKNSLHSKCFPS